MEEKSPKELMGRMTFDDKEEYFPINSFEWRKQLFDFGRDADMTLNENKEIPILKEDFHHNRDRLHVDLEYGFDDAIEDKRLITNFDNNRKQLWIHFLRCLQKYNTIAEERPDFVALTPLLCNLFCAEEQNSTFFALKYNGVIYLFRNPSIEMEDTEEKPKLHSYLFLRFLYLISNRDDYDINGIELNLKVDRIELNDKHRLIVCNGIAANDRNGTPVYAKCRKIFQRFMDQEFKRLLFDWSHCVISGVPTIIRGRRYMSTLQEVNIIDVESIPEMCKEYWSDTRCFSLVDQALDFIKNSVREDLQLYEFEIQSEDMTIDCYRHDSTQTSNHFLPDFYTQ